LKNNLQGAIRWTPHGIGRGFLGWTFVAFDSFWCVDLPRFAKEVHRPDKYMRSQVPSVGLSSWGAIIFGLIADRYAETPLFVLCFIRHRSLSGLAPNYTTFMVLLHCLELDMVPSGA